MGTHVYGAGFVTCLKKGLLSASTDASVSDSSANAASVIQWIVLFSKGKTDTN